MRTSIAVFFLLVFVSLAPSARAQIVVLTWKPSPTATTYNVYRSERLSEDPDSFTKIATAVSVTTYTDASVEYGRVYTYYVTAVDSSNTESNPSNEILVYVQPNSTKPTSGSRVGAKR